MENEKITKKWISTQLTSHCVCSTLLEICKGNEPYNEDYLICPLCGSTYNLSEVNYIENKIKQ